MKREGNYKDCMHYNEHKTSYKCDIKVKNSDFTSRYDCKKKGVCYFFKTQNEWEKEMAFRKETKEREEYMRLKHKFKE